MDKYTIYCTPEQIKRALELGAPIYTTTEHLYNHPHEYQYWVKVDIQGNHYAAKIHTTEQMIGWLEAQRVKCFVVQDMYDDDSYNIQINNTLITTGHPQYNYPLSYNSRPEATLAAIDAALEYLSNKKE